MNSIFYSEMNLNYDLMHHELTECLAYFITKKMRNIIQLISYIGINVPLWNNMYFDNLI
jgi:hypothetical protein